MAKNLVRCKVNYVLLSEVDVGNCRFAITYMYPNLEASTAGQILSHWRE
jgi:hypothetical protein